jgi:hypothetical protein
MVYELWENSGYLPGLQKETEKDLKAALINRRPIYFAGLNESASLGDISKMVANLEIESWNKSRSMLVNTNRVQMAPNVDGRSKRCPI